MTQSKTIWLVRHAQSTANRDRIVQGHLNAPLTELGLQQAHYTGLYFQQNQAEFQIVNIFASDLQRAIQTAEGTASKLNLPIKQDKRLREAYFGRWEGANSEDLLREEPEVYKKWIEEKAWRPAWCESFADLKERVFSVLEEIAEVKGNSVVVTHGGVLHSVVVALDESHTKPSFFNCNITTLQVDENKKISLKEVNFLAPQVVETKFKLVDELTIIGK